VIANGLFWLYSWCYIGCLGLFCFCCVDCYLLCVCAFVLLIVCNSVAYFYLVVGLVCVLFVL